MSKPYVWVTNEWGENSKVYLDDEPPHGPSYDVGGVKDTEAERQIAWQKRNRTFISEVHYDDDDPYNHVR